MCRDSSPHPSRTEVQALVCRWGRETQCGLIQGPGETAWEMWQSPGPQGAETLSRNTSSFLRTIQWLRKKVLRTYIWLAQWPLWQKLEGGKLVGGKYHTQRHIHTYTAIIHITELSLMKENLQNAKIYFLPLCEIVFYFQKTQSSVQWCSLTWSCVIWTAWNLEQPIPLVPQTPPILQACGCRTSWPTPARPFTHKPREPCGSGTEQSLPSSGGRKVQCFQGSRIDISNCPRGWKVRTSQKNTVLLCSADFGNPVSARQSSCNHVEDDVEFFIYIYMCIVVLMIHGARLAGKLGPSHRALNKRPYNSNALSLLFVWHLHTHSLSNRLNEMCSSALCQEKEWK